MSGTCPPSSGGSRVTVLCFLLEDRATDSLRAASSRASLPAAGGHSARALPLVTIPEEAVSEAWCSFSVLWKGRETALSYRFSP